LVNKSDKSDKRPKKGAPENPRKKDEFKAFLKIVKDGTGLEHWQNIAEALGVSKDTITDWKKHPLAREAQALGLKRALEGMEESGATDWRMWRDKAKMLGISDQTKVDVTSGGESIKVIFGNSVDGIKPNDTIQSSAETGTGLEDLT
jgi:hypothetical protein